MKWTRSRTASALALGTASALLLSACQTSTETTTPTTSATPDVVAPTTTAPVEEVELEFAYWGGFGLDISVDGAPTLVEQYEAANPNVKIVLNSGDYTAQHEALTQSLIAGSGAANIAAIDEGFITQFVSQADNFVNLLELGAGQYKDRYLAWKWAQASNADESVTIGLGSDVGGSALCYRKDLFAAAGLPSERAEVDAAIGDTWEGFIEFGKQYKEATGDGFVSNVNTSVLNPALTQLGTGYSYYNKNNELDMDNVKVAVDSAIAVYEAGISANISDWSPEWNAAFADGSFAVLACPAWMLYNINGNLPDDFTGQWDIADIPGPGGNWGGSFYTIPNQGTDAEKAEAYRFVEWIIAPEQQIAIFQAVGNLPSQPDLWLDEGIANRTFSVDILDADGKPTGEKKTPYGDAPVGKIFSKTAADIPGAIYYAPNHNAVRNAVESVLNDMQAGNVASADAWAAAVAAAEAADAA